MLEPAALKDPPDDEPPEEGDAEGAMLATMEELADAEGVMLDTDAGPVGYPAAAELAEAGTGAAEAVGSADWLLDGAEPPVGFGFAVDTCDCGL